MMYKRHALHKSFIFLLILILNSRYASTQLKVGNHPNIINKAALIELESSNQGLRLPRADTETVNLVIDHLSTQALKDSTNGMLVFQPKDSSIYFRAGDNWKKIAPVRKSIISLNGSKSENQSFDIKLGSHSYPKSDFYTDPITGKHTLVLLQASGSRVGVVNGGRQTWYGKKRFRDPVGIKSLSPGSIPFIGEDPYNYLSEDNLHLFWNNENNRLGIGTLNPTNTVEIDSETPDASGLTFKQLTSSSPREPNSKAIGVDITGKVVRATTAPAYYNQNGKLKVTKVWIGELDANSGSNYADNLTHIDISSAGFTHIYNIQATAMKETNEQEKHVLVSIINHSTTNLDFITLKTETTTGGSTHLSYNDQPDTIVFLRVEGD